MLGHYLFVYVHPYMDGNGRIARFLMNTMFASGGYPWTVVRVSERDRYLASLEHAGVERDLVPFASFLAGEMAATQAARAAERGTALPGA